jgi:hypothetical protein
VRPPEARLALFTESRKQHLAVVAVERHWEYGVRGTEY